MLKWLQWRGLKPHVEVTVSLGGAYLCFYIANAYLETSGVIATVVYGLYGAMTMQVGGGHSHCGVWPVWGHDHAGRGGS